MAKRIAVFFLVTYLCATTECYQLLKLPLFVSHFITHCQQDPDTTLLGFLKEHYFEDFVLDDDWQQDMQLPFKTHSGCQHTVSVSVQPELFLLELPAAVELDSHRTPGISNWHSHLFASRIFQPPRV